MEKEECAALPRLHVAHGLPVGPEHLSSQVYPPDRCRTQSMVSTNALQGYRKDDELKNPVDHKPNRRSSSRQSEMHFWARSGRRQVTSTVRRPPMPVACHHTCVIVMPDRIRRQ